ncbi:MAG TPA: glycosyltransferase family 39 protein [Candidatus Angelobacter sp.]
MREQLKRALSSTGAAVVAAFLIRMVVLHHVFRTSLEHTAIEPPFGAETGAVAAAIASGRGFSSPLHHFATGPTAWLTPVYPYLLAALFKLYGIYSYRSDLVIRTMDCAFSAFTCWPIAAMGTRAFGKKTGQAAAWVWVLLPSAIFFSTIWVWDTSLAGLWMALLMAMTLKLRGCNQPHWWIAYGAMWAIGAEINPSILSVLPFLALWAIWPLRQNFALAARLAVAAAFVFMVGLTPWAVRNYVVFHKLIPLRSNFGLELWLGNNPDVPDGWSPAQHPNDNQFEGAKYARMGEIAYMEEKQREGFAFIRSHPGVTALFTFHRFENNWLGIWDPPADLWAHATTYVKAVIVSGCLFSLLSLLGALLAYRTQTEAAVPFGLVLIVFPMIFYLTHTSARYRFPMDPTMEVLAVYAIAYPLSRWAGRGRAASIARSGADGGQVQQSVLDKMGA